MIAIVDGHLLDGESHQLLQVLARFARGRIVVSPAPRARRHDAQAIGAKAKARIHSLAVGNVVTKIAANVVQRAQDRVATRQPILTLEQQTPDERVA